MVRQAETRERGVDYLPVEVREGLVVHTPPLPLRRAAAAEDLDSWSRGELQGLEGGGGHRRHLPPVRNGRRDGAAPLAEPPERLDPLELKGEGRERQLLEGSARRVREESGDAVGDHGADSVTDRTVLWYSRRA
jgi:hypothetical protein